MNEEIINELKAIIDYAQKRIAILTTSYDQNAQLYFDACDYYKSPLSKNNKDSWNEFVLNTKKNGLYYMFAGYTPFFGGTDISHSIDAITGKPIIKWYGNVVHNASGFKGGYGELLINPSQLAQSNCHFSFYNRTSFSEDNNGQNTGIDFGCGNDSGTLQLKIHVASQNLFRAAIGNGFIEATFGGYGILDEELGQVIVTRRSNIDLEITRNAISKARQTKVDATPLLSLHPFIGAFNSNGAMKYPTNHQYAGFHWGIGLTMDNIRTLVPDQELLQKRNNRGVL